MQQNVVGNLGSAGGVHSGVASLDGGAIIRLKRLTSTTYTEYTGKLKLNLNQQKLGGEVYSGAVRCESYFPC